VLHRDDSGALTVTANEQLLHRWIAIVDGVAVSPDGAWLAFSNPPHHNVLVYERSASLREDSEPSCILRGGAYPHGLRFSPDGRHLFVADAGSPHVHLYTRERDSWSGVQHPAGSLRVMDDAVFVRGRRNLREGGPKGIDIDGTGRVLTVTSEFQPLGCFDAVAFLEASARDPHNAARAVSCELGLARAVEARYEADIRAFTATRTYRFAEQLRRISALRSKLRR
jgi:sugar lactone lactonase YvrE